MTNEILYELVLFKDKNKLTWRHLFKWMDCFGITFRSEANGKNVLINKAVARYSALNKSKNKSILHCQNDVDFKPHPFDSGVSHHVSDTSESDVNVPEVNPTPHKQLEDVHRDRTTLSPDIEDRLQSTYVFHSDVQLQMTNGHGCSWIVQDTLKKKFERFVKRYVL